MLQVIMSKLGKLLLTNLGFLVSVIIWMGHIVNILTYLLNDKHQEQLVKITFTFHFEVGESSRQSTTCCFPSSKEPCLMRTS